MDVTEAAQPQLPQPSPTPSKKVSFAAATHEQGPSPTPPRGASPDGKAASAAPGAACPELLHSNALFSPERQGSWTIEAQRPDRMEDPAAGGEAGPSPSPSPLPSSIGLASGGGAYTPASSTWLESARKVADLQDTRFDFENVLPAVRQFLKNYQREFQPPVDSPGRRTRLFNLCQQHAIRAEVIELPEITPAQAPERHRMGELAHQMIKASYHS